MTDLPEEMEYIIKRQAHDLGFSLAIFARGNPEEIEKKAFEVFSRYVLKHAFERAPKAKAMWGKNDQ